MSQFSVQVQLKSPPQKKILYLVTPLKLYRKIRQNRPFKTLPNASKGVPHYTAPQMSRDAILFTEFGSHTIMVSAHKSEDSDG